MTARMPLTFQENSFISPVYYELLGVLWVGTRGILNSSMSAQSESEKKLRVNIVSESEFTVQGHGVHTAFVEMVSSLRRRSDVEVLQNAKQKNVDVVHVHTVGPFSLRRTMLTRAKKVISAHVVPDSFIGSLRGAKYWRPLAALWLRLFYNRADVVLAVSDATKEGLLKLGVKRPIEISYNTIDTSHYRSSPELKQQARQKLGIAEDAFVVIGAGQVQPRKRVDIFLKMAAELPDVTFMWAGGMPFGKIASETESMNRMMKNAPSNVQFPGILPLEDMVAYYRAADVFVLPSEQETFGLVVVEAAAAGLPIVLRDIADYDATFRGSAMMAATGEEFAQLVGQLKSDPQVYEQYKAAAGEIAARFDSRAGAEQLVELYRSLADA